MYTIRSPVVKDTRHFPYRKRTNEFCETERNERDKNQKEDDVRGVARTWDERAASFVEIYGRQRTDEWGRG